MSFVGSDVTKSSRTSEGKAATRIQAAYRGYRDRRVLKEREPKLYAAVAEIAKKVGAIERAVGKERAHRLFTPSKNKIARKKM